MPGAEALAVAKYSLAVYVEVASCFTTVALTPCAVYAVVRVAVGSGMLTKSVTVCSPAALDAGGEEVAADGAASELVEGVVAIPSADLEAGDAGTEADVEFPLHLIQPLLLKKWLLIRFEQNTRSTLVTNLLAVVPADSQLDLCLCQGAQQLCGRVASCLG